MAQDVYEEIHEPAQMPIGTCCYLTVFHNLHYGFSLKEICLIIFCSLDFKFKSDVIDVSTVMIQSKI